MAEKSVQRSSSVIDQPLTALAADISSFAAIVAKFLDDNGHAHPAFAADSPVRFPTDAPPEVRAARNRLIAAAHDMHLLAQWPLDCGLYLAADGLHLVYQHFITHFKIADHVPLQGSVSYTDLVTELDLPLQKTTRILRFAMIDHIFQEPKPGYIAHTSLSRAFRKDSQIPFVRTMMGNMTELHMDPIPKYVESIEKFRHEVDTGENAPGSLAYGKPLMDYLAERPDKLAVLSATMEAAKTAPWSDPKPIIEDYDWASIGGGLMVDVGGGEGPFSKALTSAFPRIHCVVQDRASALQKGSSECPSEIASRITWQEHDFFQPNPIKDADVYFMRWIMHDWPDHSCAKILKHIMVAMGAKSRIVISDIVVPDPGHVDAVTEQLYRRLDLMMMSMNGIERSMEQWEELVAKVDGLRIEKVVKLKQESLLSLIVLVKV